MARRTRLVTEQTVSNPEPRQLPFLIRLTWFGLIGWWLAPLWLVFTIILTPLVGLIAAPELGRMYRFTGTLLTLRQH